MGVTRMGMEEGEGGRNRGEQWSTETKRRLLVEDVSEYWRFYKGEGAN